MRNKKIRELEKIVFNSFDKMKKIREDIENKLIFDLLEIEDQRKKELEKINKK